MAADGKVLVAGEITTEASVDVERTLKQLCAEVGYTMDELSTDGSLSLEGRLNQQSPDIAQAVGEGDKLGAGDQGIMVGYAPTRRRSVCHCPWCWRRNSAVSWTKAASRG